MTHEQLGNFKSAKNDLLAAIELNPTNNRIQADLGIVHLMHEDYKEALRYFNESLKLDKASPDTYFNRAISYIQLGDTTAAIKDLKTGIRLNPFSAEALRRLAIIEYEQKNYSEAIQNLNQALSLDEGNTLILFQRAISYFQLKQYDETLQDLQSVLDIDSANALVFYNRAVIYSEIGRYNEAIDDYTKAIQINPDNILTYYNRAGARIELKDFNGALNDYNKAIKIFPDFATAYLNRSIVKNLLGDQKGAYLDRKKAESLVSQHNMQGSDTSEFAQLRDTSANLKQLLDFNSEFSNSFTRGRLQNQAVDIKLQPQYFVQVALVPPTVGLTFISALFAYNQEKGTGVNLYPIIESKEFHIAKRIFIDSLTNSEQFVIQEILEEARLSNYNRALEILHSSMEKFNTQWLYYFLEGTLEASMAEYIHSMSEITNTVKLGEEGNTYSTGAEITTLADYSKAERGLTNAIDINPNFSLSWYNRANILVQSQRYREAIDDYSKALSIDENLSQAYFNRGLTLIFMKEIERGCLDISKAGQLGIVDAYNVIKRYCEKKKP